MPPEEDGLRGCLHSMPVRENVYNLIHLNRAVFWRMFTTHGNVQPKIHVHYVCIAGFLLTFFVYNYKIHYIGELSNQIE